MLCPTQILKDFVRAAKVKSPVVLNSVWTDAYLLRVQTGLTAIATDTYTWLLAKLTEEPAEPWEVAVARKDFDGVVRQIQQDMVDLTPTQNGLVMTIGDAQLCLGRLNYPSLALPAHRSEEFTVPPETIPSLLEGLRFVQSFISDAPGAWGVATYGPEGVLVGGSSVVLAMVHGLPKIPAAINFRPENTLSLKSLPKDQLRLVKSQFRVSAVSPVMTVHFPHERLSFPLKASTVSSDGGWTFNRDTLQYYLQLSQFGAEVFRVTVGPTQWLLEAPKGGTRVKIPVQACTVSTTGVASVGLVDLLAVIKRIRSEEVQCRIAGNNLLIQEASNLSVKFSALLPMVLSP